LTDRGNASGLPAAADCRSCRENGGAEVPAHGVVVKTDRWLVRHAPAPYGLAGWIVIQPIRHIAGPEYFNDEEARDFGPFLRHCQRVLKETTGALRMYNAVMAESVPHMHVHLVPRYEDMPLGLKGWSVFDVHRLAEAGELHVDPTSVEDIVSRFRQALAVDPPP
jgi:diadenosine tetraphosphate (Ap4A) HIT family hydrolase